MSINLRTVLFFCTLFVAFIRLSRQFFLLASDSELLFLPPNRLFSASSMEGIMQNLKADGSEFAKKQSEVCFLIYDRISVMILT